MLQFENPDLWNFKPHIVFIHTTWHNISEFPELLEAEDEVEQRVRREMARFSPCGKRFIRSLARLLSRTTSTCHALDRSGIWRLPNRSVA